MASEIFHKLDIILCLQQPYRIVITGNSIPVFLAEDADAHKVWGFA